MFGQLTNNPTSVTIVGGGFAGLSLAWRLAEHGCRVSVLEKESRFGGLIKTDSFCSALSEASANSLLVNQAVDQLCKELDIPLETLAPDAKARFILRDGKLSRFPLHFWELPALLSRLLFIPGSGETKTVGDWCRRHLGQAALDYLATPGLTGIYAARPDELAVKGVMPSLEVGPGNTLGIALLKLFLKRRQSKKDGSAIKPYMAIPVGGMESMIEALLGRLNENPKVTLNLYQEVTAIPEDENVVLCVPAYVAAKILKEACPSSSAELTKIKYTPIISITVVANRKQFKQVPQGTGVLIPPKEQREILGVLFCSSSFPSLTRSEDQVVLRIMIGGTHNPEVLELTDEEIEASIAKELDLIFGFTAGSETNFKVYRWPQAIPVYSPSLLAAKDQLPWCKTPGRALFGNYTGKVSLRGMVEEILEWPRSDWSALS